VAHRTLTALASLWLIIIIRDNSRVGRDREPYEQFTICMNFALVTHKLFTIRMNQALVTLTIHRDNQKIISVKLLFFFHNVWPNIVAAVLPSVNIDWFNDHLRSCDHSGTSGDSGSPQTLVHLRAIYARITSITIILNMKNNLPKIFFLRLVHYLPLEHACCMCALIENTMFIDELFCELLSADLRWSAHRSSRKLLVDQFKK
jgi:hypothetical protein